MIKKILFLLFIPTWLFSQTTQTWTVGTSARNYSTIQACENAKNDDQVTDNEIDICECYDDSDFAENVTIDGGTNDETRFFRITVASGERHAGVANGGVVNNPSAGGHAFTVSDALVELEWFQVTGLVNDSDEAIRVNEDSLTVRYFLIHDLGVSNQDGIYQGATSYDVTVENSIFYDIDRAAIHGQAHTNAEWHQVWTVNNSTAYNCSLTSHGSGNDGMYLLYAFHASTSVTMTSNNVIGMGAVVGLDFDTNENGSGTATHDGNYNMDEDGTAPGANSQNSKTISSQFVSTTGGSENLHLKAGNDAQNNGTNNGITDDIDGDSRPQGAAHDIGADEVVESAGKISLPQIIQNKNTSKRIYASIPIKKRID